MIVLLLALAALIFAAYAWSQLTPGRRPAALVRPARPTDTGDDGANSHQTRRELGALVVISVGVAMLFYLPFIVQAPAIGGIPFDHQTMDRVYGMWDGPLWVTAAATRWDPNPHNPVYGWIAGPPSNYAERFPAFPLAIDALAPLVGYWKGGLVVNVLASTAVTVLLYEFLCRFSPVARAGRRSWGASPAFWIAFIAIFWPPRGFLYRYVLMSEPLFILGILGCAYFYLSRRYLPAALLGVLAVGARPNSFLVIAGFGIAAGMRAAVVLRRGGVAEVVRMSSLLLLPLTLGAIFLWHRAVFGDWLAAFHSTNFVQPQATLYPALPFFGIGEEGVPYLFFIVLAGICELVRRRHLDLALISLLFYLPSLSVSVDVARYLLPVFPFTFALAGDRILAAPPVRVALLLSIPLVYTYAWTTMLNPGYQAPFAVLRALLP